MPRSRAHWKSLGAVVLLALPGCGWILGDAFDVTGVQSSDSDVSTGDQSDDGDPPKGLQDACAEASLLGRGGSACGGIPDGDRVELGGEVGTSRGCDDGGAGRSLESGRAEALDESSVVPVGAGGAIRTDASGAGAGGAGGAIRTDASGAGAGGAGGAIHTDASGVGAGGAGGAARADAQAKGSGGVAGDGGSSNTHSDASHDAADSDGHSPNKYAAFNEQRTWVSAQEACNQRGGNLATVHTSAQNDAAYEVCAATSGGAGPDLGCWLGAQMPFTSWNDTTPIDYTNWASGRPDANGICLWIYLYSLSGQPKQWDDWTCTWETSYVCELPFGADSSGASAVLAVP